MSAGPIRTTHTGSLPRPAEVLEAVYARQEGRDIPQERWQAVVRDGVNGVVAQQVEAGIDIVSDGELGKPGFTNYLAERLSGVEPGPLGEIWCPPDLAETPELHEAQYKGTAGDHIRPPHCVGDVEYIGQAALEEELRRFRAALDAAGAEDGFVPASSPGSAASMPNEHYASDEEYVEALAKALAVEYRAIVEAGFILQLDCPDIPGIASHPKITADAARKWIALAVEAINLAVADLPPERMRVHICWGNWEGPHHFDVPLREVLPTVWKARPTGVAFEGANARHEHEWAVFEDMSVPDDKILLPGVIDTKVNVVEHPELVAQRIERFANLVGSDRVIATTDCGFGTFAGWGSIVPKVAWMKLQALADGAALANQRLT